MVVHLPDAPLTHAAVMGTLGLDAAALWALEDDLALPETHTLNVLLGGVAAGNSALRK